MSIVTTRCSVLLRNYINFYFYYLDFHLHFGHQIQEKILTASIQEKVRSWIEFGLYVVPSSTQCAIVKVSITKWLVSSDFFNNVLTDMIFVIYVKLNAEPRLQLCAPAVSDDYESQNTDVETELVIGRPGTCKVKWFMLSSPAPASMD